VRKQLIISYKGRDAFATLVKKFLVYVTNGRSFQFSYLPSRYVAYVIMKCVWCSVINSKIIVITIILLLLLYRIS
jgi:hypothetical protein